MGPRPSQPCAHQALNPHPGMGLGHVRDRAVHRGEGDGLTATSSSPRLGFPVLRPAGAAPGSPSLVRLQHSFLGLPSCVVSEIFPFPKGDLIRPVLTRVPQSEWGEWKITLTLSLAPAVCAGFKMARRLCPRGPPGLGRGCLERCLGKGCEGPSGWKGAGCV